jgi:glycosyltransferase involved in cell wall biosynthesis
VKKKKELLYLRTDPHPNTNSDGSTSHTIGMIDAFVKSQYKVLCASCAVHGLLKNIKDIEFHPLKGCNLFDFLFDRFWIVKDRLNIFFANIFIIFKVLKLIKKSQLSFVYQRYSLLNFSGVFVCKVKKIPFILEYNGSEVWIEKNWQQKAFLSNFLLGTAKWIELYNLKKASIISVVSKAIKEELVDFGVDQEKIVVNPNGVNPSLYDPDKLVQTRKTVRQKLKIDDKFVFCFLGNFRPWHGVNQILKKIIPDIIITNQNTFFLFVGDGPCREDFENSLEEDVKENIYITGRVNHYDVEKYLCASDAFLCPTQQNNDGTKFFGSPTKIFEYMSMEKPIISSSVEQLSEIINPAIKFSDLTNKNFSIQDQVGILVEHRNIDSFKFAINWVLNCSDSKRKKIGENARKRVIKHYTWAKNVERIEKQLLKGE